MPSDSGSAWSPPASTSERRLSNSSDGSAGSGYSKATTDSADFLATRPHTAAVIPGKPAANPLQFIKVGPADLGSRAREQLRRAELAKRAEPARRERQEDWQSNLDNWKSSRRKRVEHIIERCVEVKQMETQPCQPRAKSKTFNEMLEERAGRRRRNPMALYADDDGHDLSDLGIGTSSTKSSLSEDCDTHSLASDGMDLDKNHSDVDNMSNCDTNRKLGSSANEYDTCTTTTISSPEPEEYTYEGAIEGYKSRIISQTNSNIVKTLVNNNKEKSLDKSDVNKIRTTVSNKIEEKVSSFQQERVSDTKNNNQKKDLPKVDIHKRREHFERENSQELQRPKIPDIANKKSIKERLSSLEKFTEESHQKSTSDLTKLPTEVKPLKDRLSSLEKVKTASTEPDKTKRLSNGDLSNARSLKDRLSSLKSQKSEEEERKFTKTEVKEVSMSLKERLSCLDAAKNKDIPKISVEEEISRCEKTTEVTNDHFNDSSLKSSLSGIENQMQSFCRSLDSLDINGQSSPNSFERVQSFEDFDCAEMQNNTVPSDIETEDSGIHTARDSAPADDIADLTQVASPIGEPLVSEYESSNEDGVAMEHKIEETMEMEKVPEPMQTIVQDIIAEEVEEQSKADDDSVSHYAQAISQPEELSVTEEITEIQLDKEDEDTLKSLDNQDTSVLDALEMAFQELDSQDNTPTMENLEREIHTKVEFPLEDPEFDKKISVTPLYENIDIFYQNNEADAFPLDLPANALEPPKEKPPPPPMEDQQDDELLGNGNFKHTSSARRIKKEIRNKRTSFLGIEGQVDDSYLDVDLNLAQRPDITSFLQEETKIEKLLYKKTLSHDMDARLRSSRDSGVDVDRETTDHSLPHSRQNSEPYTHVTVTSDEEECKKEQFNTNLSSKLSGLNDNIDNLDQKLQHQQEVLRFERELLQLEQEELRRQRENLLRDQNRIIQKSVQDISNVPEKPPLNRPKKESYRHSMPNLIINESFVLPPQVPERTYDDYKRKPFVSEEQLQKHFGVEESRKVLYQERVNDRSFEKEFDKGRAQPVLPPKPKSRESIEREITMRSSRVPSAVEYVNVDRSAVQMRQKVNGGNYHAMSRHTLQALSAAPSQKVISNAEWMQARNASRKPIHYNQHWLIQEAEHRRIEEARAPPRHSCRQDMAPHNGMTLSGSQQALVQDKSPLRPADTQRDDKLLTVSGKRKCSHCGEELGRGAAMIIESLSLCYHVWCFTCCVCGARLGDGRGGADVRVRGGRLHCRDCRHGHDGSKYSAV